MNMKLSKLHDVYFDLTGESLDSHQLYQLTLVLPDDIRQIAKMYGHNDTVFIERAQQYLSSKYGEFQSDKGN